MHTTGCVVDSFGRGFRKVHSENISATFVPNVWCMLWMRCHLQTCDRRGEVTFFSQREDQTHSKSKVHTPADESNACAHVAKCWLHFRWQFGDIRRLGAKKKESSVVIVCDTRNWSDANIVAIRWKHPEAAQNPVLFENASTLLRNEDASTLGSNV